MAAQVKAFYDDATNTLTYVVYSPASRSAVVIDPVWAYDPAVGALSAKSLEPLVSFLNSNSLQLKLILETHAHADHVSGAQPLKAQFPNAPVAVSERIRSVQSTFMSIYGFGSDFKADGSQFDRLLQDHEVFEIDDLQWKVFPTPGHTPACTSFLIEDKVFTGDTLFMPDSGTGRCDFPGGSAESLYDSISKTLFSLSGSTQLFVGHDYQPNGRELRFQTTIQEEKELNIHLTAKTKKQAFIDFRKQRDQNLSAPKLLWPGLQININAGIPPAADVEGRRFLKIPLRIDS
jgi:glyoxylase-like metal-dependent hydrolase (beta-lactamase superfamily II)